MKQIEKCKHPNSRKTKALAKQLKKYVCIRKLITFLLIYRVPRQSTKQKAKLSTNIKQNLLGEKLLWFRDNLDRQHESCSASDVELLILKYLGKEN